MTTLINCSIVHTAIQIKLKRWKTMKIKQQNRNKARQDLFHCKNHKYTDEIGII